MNCVTISPVVADVLTKAEISGQVVRLKTQLSREVYMSVDKVLKALGGKWDKKENGHIFGRDPAAVFSEALGTGLAVDVKKTFQFFETPEDLAQRMYQMADIEPNDDILEPSAGLGRLLQPVFAHPHYGDVVAVEVELFTFESLMSKVPLAQFVWEDFLTWAPRQTQQFDVVLMNPPFSKNQDIKHIQAAWGLLKRNGRMVAIASQHAFFAQERSCAEFRAWLETIGAEVESLPAGTFSSSGTGVCSKLIYAVKD